MAVGSKGMARGHVIVRKIGALDAIGGVTNTCSDKTGTLTQGKMLARKAMLPGGRFISVENESHPLDPTTGELKLDGHKLALEQIWPELELHRFFQIIALCNVSFVKAPHDGEAQWTATGEPTEIALSVIAHRAGCGKQDTIGREGLRLLTEHSFDSAVKRMSAVYTSDPNRELTCFTKGGTEVLLPLMKVNDATAKAILAQADAMASGGLRVLCQAYRP